MELSEDMVRTVARLASLSLDDADVEKVRAQLEDTLEFVAKLSDVNTDGVEPTSHVHGVVNAFRHDVVRPSFAVETVQKNAPDFVGAGFRVPKII